MDPEDHGPILLLSTSYCCCWSPRKCLADKASLSPWSQDVAEKLPQRMHPFAGRHVPASTTVPGSRHPLPAPVPNAGQQEPAQMGWQGQRLIPRPVSNNRCKPWLLASPATIEGRASTAFFNKAAQDRHRVTRFNVSQPLSDWWPCLNAKRGSAFHIFFLAVIMIYVFRIFLCANRAAKK